MDEAFRANELESVKKCIGILARRGYVLRSELEQIRRGCRHHAFTLSDMEMILFDCGGEDTQYIDDHKPAEAVRRSLEIQKLLNEMNFEDLFSYLEVSPEASDEELFIALRKKNNPECDSQIQRLIKAEGRHTYQVILRSQRITEELQLRQRFNLSSLRQAEYDGYLNEIILVTMVDRTTAKQVLDGLLQQMGFAVERNIEQEKMHHKQIDEFLICADEADIEKNPSKKINNDRGI